MNQTLSNSILPLFRNTLSFIILFSFLPNKGQSQTCPIDNFQKTYGGNRDDYGGPPAVSADSGYVIIGKTNSYGNGGYDGYVIKTDKTGIIQWSKAIGGTSDDYFNSIKKTADNGFIICGQTKSFGNSAGDGWLVKLDASGNVQWSKKYGDGNSIGDIALDVVQLSDGGYAFCGVHRFSPGSSQSFVVRTDNLGAVTWAREYGNSVSDEAWGLMEDGNDLLIAGFYQASSYYDGYLMKLDKSNGNLQWIKGYDVENRASRNARINKTAIGYQMMVYVLDDFSDTNQQLAVWNLNSDGTVQNIRKTVIPGIKSNSMGYWTLQDGGFMVANGQANNSSDVILAHVNSNGTLAWSKKFLRPGQQILSHIVPTFTGGWTLTGTNNSSPSILADSNNFLLLAVDSLGNGGNCSGVTTPDLTVVTPSYLLPIPDVTPIGNVTINNPVINPGVVNTTPNTASLCNNNLNFDFNYQVNVCNPLTVQFNGIGADSLNTYWSFGDGGTVTSVVHPSHTFTSFGNYLIKYSVSNGGCRDTVIKTINLSVISADIILTPDTTICFGTTKQLLTSWDPLESTCRHASLSIL